jgi:hypothetical protein
VFASRSTRTTPATATFAARFARTRLIDRERSTVEFLAVEAIDDGLRFAMMAEPFVGVVEEKDTMTGR